MPFSRPTLAALVQRARSDLRGRLELLGPILRRAVSDAVGASWAALVHMLHGHVEWAARQLFPDTADPDQLLRQASFRGIVPVAAQFAAGQATATGTNGSIIPTDTIVAFNEDARYRVTADATIAAGTATLSLQALVAGEDSNMEAGAVLALESPVAGVDSTLVVTVAGITGGFDQEEIDGTRDRFILHLKEPPAGGADQDYEAWALAVAGVTRAWVFPHENGLGTVVVRFVLDDEETGEVGFPDAGAVAAVQAALEAQRPITAEVTAAAPTPLEVDFTLSVEPDTAAVRAAVEAELADLLRREAEPGDGAGRGTILLSQIRTAIGVSEGVEDFALTVPAADVVPAAGQLPILGDVTFT